MRPTHILPERHTNKWPLLIATIFTIVVMSMLLHNYNIKRDRIALSTYTGDWIDE